jgi:hypothetical protein
MMSERPMETRGLRRWEEIKGSGPENRHRVRPSDRSRPGTGRAGPVPAVALRPARSPRAEKRHQWTGFESVARWPARPAGSGRAETTAPPGCAVGAGCDPGPSAGEPRCRQSAAGRPRTRRPPRGSDRAAWPAGFDCLHANKIAWTPSPHASCATPLSTKITSFCNFFDAPTPVSPRILATNPRQAGP